jgi:hypothetical protein
VKVTRLTNAARRHNHLLCPAWRNAHAGRRTQMSRNCPEPPREAQVSRRSGSEHRGTDGCDGGVLFAVHARWLPSPWDGDLCPRVANQRGALACHPTCHLLGGNQWVRRDLVKMSGPVTTAYVDHGTPWRFNIALSRWRHGFETRRGCPCGKASRCDQPGVPGVACTQGLCRPSDTNLNPTGKSQDFDPAVAVVGQVDALAMLRLTRWGGSAVMHSRSGSTTTRGWCGCPWSGRHSRRIRDSGELVRRRYDRARRHGVRIRPLRRSRCLARWCLLQS